MEMQLWKLSVLKKKIYIYENKINKLDHQCKLTKFHYEIHQEFPVLNSDGHETLNQNRINLKKKNIYMLGFKAKPSASLILV